MLSATAREATGVLLRLLAVTLTLSVPAVDASAEQGSFVTGCRYSHSLMDDPVIYLRVRCATYTTSLVV